MSFFLLGKRFGGEVRSHPLDTVEDAVGLAREWEDADEEYSAGWAVPLGVADEAGEIVVDRATLQLRLRGELGVEGDGRE